MEIILIGFNEDNFHMALAAIKAYKRKGYFNKQRINVRHKVKLKFEGLRGMIEVYHTRLRIHVEFKSTMPIGEFS